MKAHAAKEPEVTPELDGNIELMISTGSTLLDLAISGGRVRGGGIPTGILVEAHGPSGSGKTTLLCEIGGDIRRKGGRLKVRDPEGRLNAGFASIFGLNLNDELVEYDQPDTVPQVFQVLRNWNPKPAGVVHGMLADSLAALSTDLELGDEGDKFGMRRAKEFSEELRKVCRVITQKNLLVVCSNQMRGTGATQPFMPKKKPATDEAIGFYASLRLKFSAPTKITDKTDYAGKKITRVVGVETQVDVVKSSVWKPFRSAPLIIMYDYGIDDIRANLQFIKDYTEGVSTYVCGEEKLAQSLDESVKIVEDYGLVEQVQQQTIAIWEDIESRFVTERRPKQR